ncbi:MAG: hypothetical protein HRT47_05780 [Candidatus Caenarcaniphilales bacterium]|nr:hypothetical protein [Candidatus Caenarcaniphilales bacterium]
MAILEHADDLVDYTLEDYESASDELVRSSIAKFKRVIMKQLANHAKTSQSAILDVNDPYFNDVLKTTVENIFTSASRALFDNEILSLKAYNDFGETIAEYFFIQDEDQNIYQVFICMDEDGNVITDYHGRLQLDDSSQPVCISDDGSAEFEMLTLSFKILNHLKYMILGEDDMVVPLTKVFIDYATDELKMSPYDLNNPEDMKRFSEIVKNSGFSIKKSHPILSVLQIR